jgi:putative hydrolase of the HAD superfamily
MSDPRFRGLVLDFFGVLTSSMVEVIESFERREKIPAGTFYRAWADPAGQELFRRVELGRIEQVHWNDGYAALMSNVCGRRIDPDGLMERYLADAFPAWEMIKVAKQARAYGVRTAVLSNSLGRAPYDPYAAWDLSGTFDVVVLSGDVELRKPDPAVFRLTCDRLGVPAEQCVFANDSEENLKAAVALGMTPLFALDERVAASRVRLAFGLPDL